MFGIQTFNVPLAKIFSDNLIANFVCCSYDESLHTEKNFNELYLQYLQLMEKSFNELYLQYLQLMEKSFNEHFPN
jgi:hypothetical protein